jgi:hypothetical protein
MADRYRAIGITEIVVYAPRPQERAVFDKVSPGWTTSSPDRAVAPSRGNSGSGDCICIVFNGEGTFRGSALFLPGLDLASSPPA